MPNFAKLAKPLIQLTKGSQEWEWTSTQQAAFQALKDALDNTSWLATPHNDGRYKIYTDFCAEAMGAALHQVQDGEEKPIAFASRVCKGPEVNLDSPSGELAEAIYAL